MSRLLQLVRAMQRDQLTADQRSALERLAVAVDVAAELDPQPRSPWTTVAHAWAEVLDAGGDDGGAAGARLRVCGS